LREKEAIVVIFAPTSTAEAISTGRVSSYFIYREAQPFFIDWAFLCGAADEV
jgi:hypothetical protein